MFTIIVTQNYTHREVSATEAQLGITPAVEVYRQTVESLELKRVIDAVNPTTRKRRKGSKEEKSA